MGWRNEQQRQAWANWINAEQWDVFGTLNFKSLNHIRRADRDDVCGKMWRSYFGAIDRALYGQQRKRQCRFSRVVLVQYGSNGDYPHVHFLAKSPLPIEKFCILLNAAWASMYSASAPPTSNEITPIIEKTRTTGYVLHEMKKLGGETYDYRLSNTNKSSLLPSVRDDAEERLRQLSTTTNRIKAIFEFPNHIQAAQARMDKRDRLATAAMLR
ncbi:MAG: hypothetical protein ACXIU7_10695 [Roseinatronobacter sp.]